MSYKQRAKSVTTIITIVCILAAAAYYVKCRVGVDLLPGRHLGVFKG